MAETVTNPSIDLIHKKLCDMTAKLFEISYAEQLRNELNDLELYLIKKMIEFEEENNKEKQLSFTEEGNQNIYDAYQEFYEVQTVKFLSFRTVPFELEFQRYIKKNMDGMDGIDATQDVINHFMRYDLTTTRASIPMFLMPCELKSVGVKRLIFEEGYDDEIFIGYLDSHKAPNKDEFHQKICWKIKALHRHNCLRTKKSTFALGLQGPVPFSNKEFINVAMNIVPEFNWEEENNVEKQMVCIEETVLRCSNHIFYDMNPWFSTSNGESPRLFKKNWIRPSTKLSSFLQRYYQSFINPMTEVFISNHYGPLFNAAMKEENDEEKQMHCIKNSWIGKTKNYHFNSSEVFLSFRPYCDRIASMLRRVVKDYCDMVVMPVAYLGIRGAKFKELPKYRSLHYKYLLEPRISPLNWALGLSLSSPFIVHKCDFGGRSLYTVPLQGTGNTLLKQNTVTSVNKLMKQMNSSHVNNESSVSIGIDLMKKSSQQHDFHTDININNQHKRKQTAQSVSSFVMVACVSLWLLFSICSQSSMLNKEQHGALYNMVVPLFGLFGFMVFVWAVAVMILVGAPFTGMQNAMLLFWAILMHVKSASSISDAVYVPLIGIFFIRKHAAT